MWFWPFRYSSLTLNTFYILFLALRAQRVGTASHPVRRRKTSCPLTRSRSRERGRGRDNERGRSERWRDADSRKDCARKNRLNPPWRKTDEIWSSGIDFGHLISATGTVIVTTVRTVSASESVCSGRKRRGNTWCGRDTGWRLDFLFLTRDFSLSALLSVSLTTFPKMFSLVQILCACDINLLFPIQVIN